MYVCMCVMERKLLVWSPIKPKAMVDVLGKWWWDEHIIVWKDQKVTWGPYTHGAVLGPAVKPVLWLKFMFIVLR